MTSLPCALSSGSAASINYLLLPLLRLVTSLSQAADVTLYSAKANRFVSLISNCP